jgi:cytoskeletal protein RodZ
MTRTDVMASSRPRTVGAASMRRRSSSILRGLSVLPVALLLALALAVPSTAVAAEPTSGYKTEPPKPGTTTVTTTTTTPATTTPATTTPATTPSTGTLPSKESEKPTTPAKEVAPAKASTTPTTTTEKASTLPFTGFDLRWDIGFGLLLMGAGFSIVVAQRRQRGQRGR